MSENNADVLEALQGSVGEVSMHATADEIVAVGRSRRRRRSLAGVAGGAAGVTALALAMAYGGASSAPPDAADSATLGAVHIHEVGYTVDTKADGTIHVTWDKQRYFQDRAALEAALRQAGMPVVMRVGEFCVGPGDDATLDPSGVGPGVDKVMKGESTGPDKVTFVFTPSAVPAGKQLFIGYLNSAQLAVTQGRPGSVERLVSTGVTLTCTTTAPPAHK
jgi:hypothetical protein